MSVAHRRDCPVGKREFEGLMTIAVALRRILQSILACIAMICLASQSALAAEPLRATSYKMTGDAKSQTIEVAFDRDPDLNWFLLSGPPRLVLDMALTRFVFEPASLKSNRMVESVRYGEAGEGRSRLILSAKGPFVIDKVDMAEAGAGSGRKLVVNLRSSSPKEFEAALADQQVTTASTKPISTTSPAAEKKRFTIVLDPGHGGIDGGAKGAEGTSEKTVTLLFAQELKAILEATGRYDVLMTRTDDSFIRLDDRVAFARGRHADLFVSIHADTIRYKGLRGATVYTVSDEASDAEAAALADRENLSDQVAGIEIEEENPDVADILVELVRRETHGFSVGFARQLVDKLSTVTGMIKNPHRHAGFRVLRAPDVPSVLIELGYLSNAKDEEQLLDPEWRKKMASSIGAAIDNYAGTHISSHD